MRVLNRQMDHPPSAAAPTFQSKSRWLGQIVLYLLVWLSLIKLPSPPSTDLDPSWQMVLGQATHLNLQHGRDIVFTYGPLGYVGRSSAYMGELFGAFMTWQIVTNLLIAAGLFVFGRKLKGWRQFVYYAYLLWFCTCYADAMHMDFIAIFGLMLIRPEYRRPAWILAIAAGFAIFSLVKFTNLMLCVFTIGILAGYYLLSRSRAHATLLAGTFIAVFVAGWMVCGQALSNLPAFLYYGMQISTGYVGAMGIYESSATLAFGLAAAASVVIYAALHLAGSTNRLQAASSVAIVGAVIFLNWKHGFVRADGHVLAHYIMVLLVICTYPALTADNERWSWAKNLVLGAGAAVCFLGIIQFSPPTALEAPSLWNGRLVDNIRALADLPALHRKLDRDLHDAAAIADKPTIRNFVGRETVDQLGSDQGQIILNHLNYTPRPVVQGYIAFTDPLNRLDEAFYRSDRGPRFVIQRYQSIDNRLISLDDSLTLKLLFQNYDYAFEEGGLLLWERPPKLFIPTKADEPVVLRKTVQFDDNITVPESDRPLWAEIHVKQNLAGKLRQFLYKPPTLRLELEDDHGVIHDHLLIRAIGETGFILQPYFNDGKDLIAYQDGGPPRKIRRLAVHTMPGGSAYYQKGIEVELRALAPFTRRSEGIKVTTPQRFRMMNRAPQRIFAGTPVIDAFVDEKHLLQMHPTSLMEFSIDRPVTSLHASFGIMPGAYKGPEGTQGVEFIVEWENSDGHRERLYSKFLDPMRRSDDRPMQSLSIELGSRRGGKLLLRTEPGPSGNRSYCWSYWTDVKIE